MRSAKVAKLALLGVGFLLLATSLEMASAQQRRPQRRPATVRPAAQPDQTKKQSIAIDRQAIADDDIAIIVNLRADSLRFDVVPNTANVEFSGKPDRATVWEVERDNLPRPVQPGVTYRDIGIRLKITSRFRDIERIVAEALGEIPIEEQPATDSQTVSIPQKTSETSPGRSPQRGRP